MAVAKTPAKHRLRVACCFDWCRSERDCPCMPDSVRCNVDSPRRDLPLSGVSVYDCSATLRACKLSPVTCAPLAECLCLLESHNPLCCARPCHGLRCYAACLCFFWRPCFFKCGEACQSNVFADFIVRPCGFRFFSFMYFFFSADYAAKFSVAKSTCFLLDWRWKPISASGQKHKP